MKQKILLLAMALLGCMNVVKAADEADKVTIDEVTIKQGGYGCFSFKISLNRQTKIPYDGAQIEFELPDGLSYNQFKIGSDATYSSPNGKFNPKDDGTGTFILFHIDQSGFIFSGTKDSYEFLKIYFKADENMPVGDYKIKIDLRLSCVNATDETLTGDYNADDPNHFLDTQKEISVNILKGGPRILSDESNVLPEDNYTYEVTTYEYDENGTETGATTETTTVPEDFIIERTIKANTWSTMCLPFKMTFDELFEIFGDKVELAGWDTDEIVEGSKAWVYDSEKDALDLNFYTFDPQYDSASFDTRKPFLIKTTDAFTKFEVKNKYIGEYNEAKNIYTPLSDWITDSNTGGTVISKTYGRNTSTFNGVLISGKVPDGCIFFSGNKFYYSTGESPIKAFRAYFKIADANNLKDKTLKADGSANVSITIDNVPTYVEGISTKYVGNGDVYSVSGIKMGTESDLNSMKPGMYIVNGKKVIIK